MGSMIFVSRTSRRHGLCDACVECHIVSSIEKRSVSPVPSAFVPSGIAQISTLSISISKYIYLYAKTIWINAIIRLVNEEPTNNARRRRIIDARVHYEREKETLVRPRAILGTRSMG